MPEDDLPLEVDCERRAFSPASGCYLHGWHGWLIYRAAFDLAVHLEMIARNFGRYHKYTLGTVTDNLAGLVWLSDASCSDTVGA